MTIILKVTKLIMSIYSISAQMDQPKPTSGANKTADIKYEGKIFSLVTLWYEFIIYV